MDTRLQLAKASETASCAEAVWLTIKEVMAFEGISPRECYSRMEPGDRHPLHWKNIDGKAGRLIYARSMSQAAQERWRKHALAATAEPKPTADAPPERGQLSLLPRAKTDDKIAALCLPESMRNVVIRRYRIVDLCLNHNWKAQRYPSKRAFLNALAKANDTSTRSIQRWAQAYKDTGELISLANDMPGPELYTGTVLDDDMRAHLQGCWTLEKLNVRQCYASLMRYLEDKQKSPGCRVSYLYPIPSYRTVARFIRSLTPLDHAARKGPEALKAACGYIDRTYRDCKSLDRVETDECRCNFFAYDPKRLKDAKGRAIVERWWLLTFYDTRSMYPLVGKLVVGSQYDPKHGIREADEIEILVRLLKEYGVPGAIYSDHGRFRGKTFGGHARKFEKFDGILDRLGIRKSEPREKNPRGSRLERFHRYLADQSRGVPGWIGANTKERKSAPGDEQAALHERWVKGDPDVPRTPLLSTIEAMAEIEKWMEAWRDHESEGTDMDGLSPRAVFVHNTPDGGFRKLSDEQIAWETAEHIPNKLIEKGGIIQLRDGTRYSHPALILIQGERREVVRLRDDHSRISVLPAAKGEEVIIVPRRARVGLNDPDNLAREMELQKKVLKLAGRIVEPLEINASFSLLGNDAAALPAPEREISGQEYVMEVAPEIEALREVKPRDFADLTY